MSILINNDTKLVVQGITGKEGAFHTRQMLDYGTQIIAGVTPGKGGQKDENGIPIFNTVTESVSYTGANASIMATVKAPPRPILISTSKLPAHIRKYQEKKDYHPLLLNNKCTFVQC